MSQTRVHRILDALSSKKPVKYTVYTLSTVFFFVLILIPPILGIIVKWDSINYVLSQPELSSRALNAVAFSFAIALFVAFIDLVAGLPMAWYVARGKSRWLSVLDTFADIPFIVPTVTLGYSLLLFWSRSEGISSLFGGSIVSPGWLLVMLLHFVFSFPVVVRVMVGALMDYKMEYEEAARSLGAAPLTADRTVTLPILKPSLVSAFTLAFARSISETGATMMVAGAFENGPVFIQNMKNGWAEGVVSQTTYEGSMVLASFILIVVSCAIFAAIRLLGPRLRLPIKRVWPSMERKLSGAGVVNIRNIATLIVFFLIVLVPSLYVALPAFEALTNGTLNEALTGTGIWQSFWQSMLLSYFIGAVVTIINVTVGLPMAVLIARKRFGKAVSTILDIAVTIPLIVPSVALGASLSIFWRENFAFIPELWLLIFAHLSITYPYFVRAMSAAIERISIDLEDAARILGAKPYTVFKTIIFPLTKYSLFAGAIMVFTRSVDETGATLAVIQPGSPLKTAPVLLAKDWVIPFIKNPAAASVSAAEIGLGCGFLILMSFLILLVLRFIVKGGGRY